MPPLTFVELLGQFHLPLVDVEVRRQWMSRCAWSMIARTDGRMHMAKDVWWRTPATRSRGDVAC